MIEVKNQFARHGLLWIWVLPLVLVLIMPAFVSKDSLSVPPTETQLLHDLGQDVGEVTQRADAMFRSLFVDSGIVQGVRKTLGATYISDAPLMIKRAAKAAMGYQENFWTMTYRAIWRLSGLWPTFLALGLAFVLPALVDGAVARAKKADTFQASNPVFFWMAGHSVVMVLGLFFLLPLLPIAISMPVLYGTVACVSGALWMTASHFQTGV